MVGGVAKLLMPGRDPGGCADPADDYLLALAAAGKADYLVTGDKGGLLTLGRHKTARIVTASAIAGLL